MKTIKEPLFEKLISYENLDLAIENSSKHKLHRKEVREVLENKDKVIADLQFLLKTKSLKFPTHKGVVREDGIRHKKRIIVKPDYKYELILQWAVIQVLKPVIMKGMYVWSCGSIEGRGAVYGKRYLQKYIKNNPKKVKYVLKADIYHFFQSVNIDFLKAKFAKKIRDKDMLYVINLILDCKDVEFEGKIVDMGLPIGFYTSQFFANYYLQELDHYIKEQLHFKCYVRYIDDIVILGNNKKVLRKGFYEISKFLAGLDLKVKGNWQIFKFDCEKGGRDIDFMGFRFFRNKVIIRRAIYYKAMRKFNQIHKNEYKGNIKRVRQALCYLGYFKHTNTYFVYKNKVCELVNIGKLKKIVSNYDKRRNNKNV